MGETIPAGRVGTPEEFAAVVTFLASARASYVNGTSIAVDAGLSGAFYSFRFPTNIRPFVTPEIFYHLQTGADVGVPEWAPAGKSAEAFFSITRTAEEMSIVAETDVVLSHCDRRRTGE